MCLVPTCPADRQSSVFNAASDDLLEIKNNNDVDVKDDVTSATGGNEPELTIEANDDDTVLMELTFDIDNGDVDEVTLTYLDNTEETQLKVRQSNSYISYSRSELVNPI